MQLLPLVSVLLARSLANAAPSSPIVWQGWSDNVFDQAKREHKFVLLDLEAVWCHWCHVMDETTYSDPQVIALMQSEVHCRARRSGLPPDLSNRYEDYGWPATVVFAADGSEIVKRQGYIEPKEMIALLQGHHQRSDARARPSKPKPTLSFGDNSQLSDDLRKDLAGRFHVAIRHQAWQLGIRSKISRLESASSTPCCPRAIGDPQAEHMARQTLDAAAQTDRSRLGRRLSILRRRRLE